MKKLEFGQTIYYTGFSYNDYDNSLTQFDQNITYYIKTSRIINFNEKEVCIENGIFMEVDKIFLTEKEAKKEKKRLEKIEYDKHYGPDSEFGKKTLKIIDKVLGKGKKK